MSDMKIRLEKDWIPFLVQWLTLSLALHLIAAIRGQGFFTWEEHFLTLERVSYLLGKTPRLEFSEIENLVTSTWILPICFSYIARFMRAIGLDSPFDWALGFRVFSGFMGWLSIVGISTCTPHWIQNTIWRRRAVIALCTLGILPFFHSRPWDVNLSGSFFWIGLSTLSLSIPQHLRSWKIPRYFEKVFAIVSGFCLGVAVDLSPILLFGIIGAILWLAIIARISFRQFFLASLGFCVAALLGCLSNLSGAGQWAYSPYQYFNWILTRSPIHPAINWPLWANLMTLYATPFLLIFALWIRSPKSMLSWTLTPILGVFLFSPSENWKWLASLTHVAVVAFIMTFQGKWSPRTLKWTQNTYAAINLFGFIGYSVFASWVPISFYQNLFHMNPYGVHIYYQNDSFIQIKGEQYLGFRISSSEKMRLEKIGTMRFYLPDDIPMTSFHQYSDFIRTLKEKERPLWLFYTRQTLPPEAKELVDWCKVEFSTLPDWRTSWNQLWKIPQEDWTLFRCQSPTGIKMDIHES